MERGEPLVSTLSSDSRPLMDLLLRWFLLLPPNRCFFSQPPGPLLLDREELLFRLHKISAKACHHVVYISSQVPRCGGVQGTVH